MERTARLLSVLAAVTVLGACIGAAGVPSATPEPLVLAAYDVPPAYTAELGSIIRRLLQPQGGDKPGIGSASVAPGGKLLVAAPAGIQVGVKELVSSLASKNVAPPLSVAVDVWIVAGRPAAATSIAPELAAIQAPLETVEKNAGPLRLELLEHLYVNSVSGERARASGAHAELRETATVLGDKVIADLEIDPKGPPEHTTRVQLTSGQWLVLGQAGYYPVDPLMPFYADRETVKNLTLFYVVRAEAAAP